MRLQRLHQTIRRRLNPPREIDRVSLPLGAFKPVEARIESGLRESGVEFETFHFETWKEGFTPEQIPDIVRLCIGLAERYYFDYSQPEHVRALLLWFLNDPGLLESTLEEMENGWLRN